MPGGWAPARQAMARGIHESRALAQAGVVENPIMPLATGAIENRQGVFQRGAVVLSGDVLLEALNGDAIARQQLKQRQAMRKQQDLRRYVGMQQQAEAQAKRALWTAQQGMQGRKAAVQKTVVLRREPDLSSEKVGRVPKGAHVHVLEMKPPDRDGVRRALVQDVWGKNSGWMTAVEVDGEQNLVADLPQADVEAEDDGRGGWLQRPFQGEMWKKMHYTKHDEIAELQDKDQRKTLQLQQMRKEQRQAKSANAAGQRPGHRLDQGRGARPGSPATPAVGKAFRAARLANAPRTAGSPQRSR